MRIEAAGGAIGVLACAILTLAGCSAPAEAPAQAAAPANAEPEEVAEPLGPGPMAPLETSGLDPASEAFVRFCERTLLVRRSAAGDPGGGDLRSAWFGELVVPAPGTSGHAIAALGDALVEAFRREDPDGARAVEAALGGPRITGFEWAKGRVLALEERMGAAAFRAVLREVVDRGRTGEPQSYEALVVACALHAEESDAAWARAWLSHPARPAARAGWRHDPSRKRLIVRVDQIHAVEAGAASAYPFGLPVRLHHADGSLEDSLIEITARRGTYDVPCDSEPVAVTFDPDGALSGLVDLRDD